MEEFDASEIEPRQNARIVKSAVTPRPIAWVSTRSEDGVDNLAPFSSYNYLGASQPIVMINTSKRDDGRLKDTARHAIDTGEFAVNVSTEANLEEMDHTSKSLPPEESEFDLAGVERGECRRISPPRVADAAVTMECSLHDTIEVYDRTLVLGDVEYYHVSESVMTDGQIDAAKVDSVGRLGGPYYTISRPVEFERQF